jgi:polyisoprenoid-binding protein YceI
MKRLKLWVTLIAVAGILPTGLLAQETAKAEKAAPVAQQPTPAPAETKPVPRYEIVPERSKLKFVAIANGKPTQGAFKTFTADIRFSPEDLANSSITAEVDIASLFTADSTLASHLLDTEWLDAKHHPNATFRTIAITMMPSRPHDSRRYFYSDAELTIRGVTIPVQLNFALEWLDEKGAVTDGYISFWRRSVGVGQGRWQSTDEVEDVVSAKFRITARRVL